MGINFESSEPLSFEMVAQLRAAVIDVFEVHEQEFDTDQLRRRVVRLRGRFLTEASRAYDRVASRFRELGYTALFREDGGKEAILAIPGTLSQTRSGERPWLAAALFVATLISVFLVQGWEFALSLLSILLAHEMGHYLVARRFDVPVSLPYFIPMPFFALGTMGAFIRMQGPPKDRRQLLAIAAAGPLAGLVLAIPILILGLSISEVHVIPPPSPDRISFIEGNSLLYAGLKIWIFGRFLPSGGEDVFLHPVAFAGWVGLLVTALNLIPAGQLDGGHAVYALLGNRARPLYWVIILTLVGLGLRLWNGWFLWAALIFFFGQRHATPFNDITPLEGHYRTLALFVIILFILVFVPTPFRIQ
ncbi:MAG: site-2 protease family protein [Candidatus Bipolaricaulia bacterium]